jgi:hypothetical protein
MMMKGAEEARDGGTDFVFLELHEVEVLDAFHGVVLQAFMERFLPDHFA